jgi:hypothetical protein
MKLRRQLSVAEAETIAIRALGFLAAEPERLGRFLSITGLGPENLRAAAREPRFLASVLDHIAGDEALLVALAAELAVSPETIVHADALLNPREDFGA